MKYPALLLKVKQGSGRAVRASVWARRYSPRGCLVNGRNSDASRARQAIVTIEEPRPSIRCCGPDGPCARRTAALEFVDDVEVITRGDGIGGVQQIGLAAVRGRPNACELAMPLLIVQRTPVPAHARQPRKPRRPIPSGSMFLTIRWINVACGRLDASVRRLFPRGWLL